MTAAARPTSEMAADAPAAPRRRTPSPVSALVRKDLRLASRDSLNPKLSFAFSLLLSAGMLALAWRVYPGEPLVAELLHATFFCIAFAWMTIGGASLASTAIAEERANGTWDALVMTGVSPRRILLAKATAAYARLVASALYLAPHAALALLFEGVTKREVGLAFAGVLVLGAPSVALGLALGTVSDDPRRARALAVVVSSLVVLVGLGAAGYGLSFPVHRLWAAVPEGSPVWLPTALDRVPFGKSYVLALVVGPAAVVALPTLGLFEIAVASLRSHARQRARGLELWTMGAVPVTALLSALPVLLSHTLSAAERWASAGLTATTIVICSGALALAGQPVRSRSAGRSPGALTPPITRTAIAQLLLGAACIGGLAYASRRHVLAVATTNAAAHGRGVVALAAYALVFSAFTVAIVTLFGTLTASRARVRLLGVAFIVGALLLPVAASALARHLTGSSGAEALAVASPLYARSLADDAILHAHPHRVARAAWAAVCAWGTGAIVIFGAAILRALGMSREAAVIDAERSS
jgi:hypothetical protein